MDRHVLSDRDLEFPPPRATADETKLSAIDLERRVECRRAIRIVLWHDPDRHGQPSRDAANRQVAGYGQPAVHLACDGRAREVHRGMPLHVEEFIRAQKIFLFHVVEVHAVRVHREVDLRGGRVRRVV